MLKEILVAAGIVACTHLPIYDTEKYFAMPEYQKNTTLFHSKRWETMQRWLPKKTGIVQDYREYINGKVGDYKYWVGFALCDGEIIRPPYIIKDLKKNLTYIDEDRNGIAEKVLKNYKGHLEEYAPFCQEGGE